MVIYKTTNLINGKYYIGKDIHNNPKYLGSGIALRKAIEKGVVEVIEQGVKKELWEFKKIEEVKLRIEEVYRIFNAVINDENYK